jgi:hypothetical protein
MKVGDQVIRKSDKKLATIAAIDSTGVIIRFRHAREFNQPSVNSTAIVSPDEIESIVPAADPSLKASRP